MTIHVDVEDAAGQAVLGLEKAVAVALVLPLILLMVLVTAFAVGVARAAAWWRRV